MVTRQQLCFVKSSKLRWVHDLAPPSSVTLFGGGIDSGSRAHVRCLCQSPKEAEKLKEAKDEVYLKGFCEGVMLVGSCKGMKVRDVEDRIMVPTTC